MLRLVARYEDRMWSLRVGRGLRARIGSAEDNDLVLPVPGISRHHARLSHGAEGVRLLDLGSKNSLLLAGRRYRDLMLTPGLTVQMGRAMLMLEEVESADAELALTLETAELDPDSKTYRIPDTEALPEELLGTPGAAIDFVRRLCRPRGEDWRREHGEAANSLLGSSALLGMVVDVSGEVTLSHWSGTLPTDEVLAELGRGVLGLHPERSDWLRLGEGIGCLVRLDAHQPRACLAAVYPAQAPRPKRWRWELFRFLADLHGIGCEPASGEEERGFEEEVLRPPPGMVVGESPAIRELMRRIRASVRSRLDVLLLGETGTGKELFARLVHRSGPTRDGPFVALNCAAIPADLLEAELFGVARGAATGVEPRPGHFLRAEGGSLLLDEIGEMPPSLQAKLLRVVEEREVLPVGASESVPVQVRMISSTNRDLHQQVREGAFRSDLYYRLCGHQFLLPPLRERREDIPRLALHFASLAAAAYGKRILGISRRAVSLLMAHGWPGNVRQLRTEVERAVLLCPSGGSLEGDHFLDLDAPVEGGRPAETAPEPLAPASTRASSSPGGHSRSLQEKIDEVEREAIREALAETGGNKTRAAQILGITRHGLSMKISRLGLRLPVRS